ncbi:hypothetical protein FHT85_004972 [Rhizobium sp. BK312]|nr:hypothetical protein [Rhizobium sp. BK312]
MTIRYPDLADVGSLELGAKLAKGEMKWVESSSGSADTRI